MGVEHTEVEQKLDVALDTVLPQMGDLPGVVSVDQAAGEALHAVYYDTPQLDLLRAGMTLRRRTGGADEGWHLKLPLGGRSRQELRLPIDAAPDVPEELLESTHAVRDGRLPAPVASITTRRVAHRLRDDRGRVLVEVADDLVHGERLPAGLRTSWREWEAEVVEGPPELLDACVALLCEAGAVPAAAPSKLARVLGDVLERPPRPPVPASAADVLGAYLEAQADQLRRGDPLMRSGAPDSVHKTRVAARRGRSALATFAPLLQPGSWEQLVEDLRWLGLTLGEARDAEVLAARMGALLAQEPDSPGQLELSRRIAAELAARAARGQAETRALLDSERYHRLLDSLEAFATAPPLTATAADAPASEVVELVAREWKRLRRRARAATTAAGGEQRDQALHEVRKAAKRLRYAAEATVPVLGRRARVLAASSTALQDTLGEHHDSVVARALLRSVGAGERGYDVDRLHAREALRADELEKDYEAAMDVLLRDHPGRWLRQGSGLAAHLSGGEPGLESP